MLFDQLVIISGGQTGVDRAALDAALALGRPCDGWCPAGRLAEDGPLHSRYPLKETSTADYLQRTRQNVLDSDATLILYFERLEGGTARTEQYCVQDKRPCLLLDMARLDETAALDLLQQFIQRHQVRRLNVAGPRASKQPQAYAVTHSLITRLLTQTN